MNQAPRVAAVSEETREPSPSDTPRSGTENAARAAFERVPPLVLLAVAGAIAELVLARAAWHTLTELWPASEILELRRWARFPRNLAAVSGLVALVAALFAFLRAPSYAPIGRRLAVAAFSGVFVPSVAATAVLAPTHVRRKLVVFSLAAANVLVTLLAMSAVRYRAERALRLSVGLASATTFLTLTTVGLTQLIQAEGGFWRALGAALLAAPGGGEALVMSVRHLGELCWVGVLVTGAVTAAWDSSVPGVRARLTAVIALTLACTGALVALRHGMGQHRFGLLLFGAFRFGFLVDAAPAVYAFPLGLGLAGGLAGLIRREPTMRQLGAGLLLWLAAGFAPHTPIQLLYLVLGAALLARAAQARDRVSDWPQRQPWARWTGSRAP